MTLDFGVKLNGENPDLLSGLKKPADVDPHLYPVLTRALENVVPAYSVRIEDDGGFENWQQIYRFVFEYKFADPANFAAEASKALGRLLADIELSAVHGIPGHSMTVWGPQTMGGVRHYLGRDLRPEDEIGLRPLQMPLLLLMRGEYDIFSDVYHHGEWLCETSLWVKAAEEE